MKAAVVWLGVALATLGGFGLVLAEDLKAKVKVEIESVGLHPGMPPGLYVCAAGHLHIKGTVQNLADVALGQITVAGKAFDPEGKLLGKATASTKEAALRPGETAAIDLEFLTVTGPLIRRVHTYEVAVVDASRAQ